MPEYRITDGNATEEHDFRGAVEAIQNWWSFLVDEERLEQLPSFPPVDNYESLQEYANEVTGRVAVALGYEPFYAHTSYYVTAAAEAGMHLTIEEIA